MRVIVEDVELRGFDIKTSKQSNEEYAVLYFEDYTGKANNVLCRNVELVRKYFEKGLTCNLVCSLEITKYTRFELIEFQGVGK